MGMFAAGMVIGGTIAIILMAMCQMAGAADEAAEKMMGEEDGKIDACEAEWNQERILDAE